MLEEVYLGNVGTLSFKGTKSHLLHLALLKGTGNIFFFFLSISTSLCFGKARKSPLRFWCVLHEEEIYSFSMLIILSE